MQLMRGGIEQDGRYIRLQPTTPSPARTTPIPVAMMAVFILLTLETVLSLCALSDNSSFAYAASPTATAPYCVTTLTASLQFLGPALLRAATRSQYLVALSKCARSTRDRVTTVSFEKIGGKIAPASYCTM